MGYLLYESDINEVTGEMIEYSISELVDRKQIHTQIGANYIPNIPLFWRKIQIPNRKFEFLPKSKLEKLLYNVFNSEIDYLKILNVKTYFNFLCLIKYYVDFEVLT